MSVDFDYSNRVVLVTGGTRGIGEAIGRAFATAGADVTVTGVEAREVADFDPDDLPLRPRLLDVRDAGAIDSLSREFTRLDALVLAAGKIVREGREHEPDIFDDVLAVNLSGAMRVAQSLKPALVATGGSVVTVASMLSQFGSGRAPAYSASKGGIAQLTKSLAVAWAADGVRVNAIAPGWIRTELTRPLQDDPETSEFLLSRTPMGRWGEPEDVSGAALFLASGAARFITGAILPVDGGYSVC